MDDRRFLELYALGLAVLDPRTMFPNMDRIGASADDFKHGDIACAMRTARDLYEETNDVDAGILASRMTNEDGLILAAMDAVPYKKPSPANEYDELAASLKSESRSNSSCGAGSRR